MKSPRFVPTTRLYHIESTTTSAGGDGGTWLKLYEVSTELDRIDTKFVHNYLSNESYWANGITIQKVERSIQHSLCFGVYFLGEKKHNNKGGNQGEEEEEQEEAADDEQLVETTISQRTKDTDANKQQQQQRQVGFGRVISDYTTYAYVADVFIDPNHRGQGLSKLLMENIMEHSELQDLRSWTLLTEDAHELYKRYGFTRPGHVPRYMVYRPNNNNERQEETTNNDSGE